MSARPLVLLLGLTSGDYLLWNWSLSGNHTVLALVAGLSLPPLAVACVLLLALTLGRALGWLLRTPSARPARGVQGARLRARDGAALAAHEQPEAEAAASSRKLAA